MNSTTRLFRNLAFGLTSLITASLIVATAVEGVAGSGKAPSGVYDAAWLSAFRRPRTLLLYLSIAFISVIITYFGVNYLLPGLHSYA